MKKFLVALSATLLLLLGLGAPAAAAPKLTGEQKYQSWLDERAMTVSLNGVVTHYSERQRGVAAYQEMKHQQFVGGVSTQTIWWNCAAGVGCEWILGSGGGDKITHSVGSRGIGNCYYDPSPYAGNTSSASADYGSGYDLKIWLSVLGCTGTSYIIVYSSHSANFSGLPVEDENIAITINTY